MGLAYAVARLVFSFIDSPLGNGVVLRVCKQHDNEFFKICIKEPERFYKMYAREQRAKLQEALVLSGYMMKGGCHSALDESIVCSGNEWQKGRSSVHICAVGRDSIIAITNLTCKFGEDLEKYKEYGDSAADFCRNVREEGFREIPTVGLLKLYTEDKL